MAMARVSNPRGLYGGKVLRRPLSWGVKGTVKRHELATYARAIRKAIGTGGANRWMTSRGANGATWIRGQWKHQRLAIARSPSKRFLAKGHMALSKAGAANRSAKQRAQSRVNGRGGSTRRRRKS